jgi:hypothetical protein
MPKPKLEFRPKPPAPSPEEVERFISQGSERSSVQAPETPNIQTLKAPSIQTSESVDVQEPKRPDIQASKNPDVQALGHADTQEIEMTSAQTSRGSDIQAPERPNVSTQPKKKKQTEMKGPGLVQRQSGVVRRRMTIYLSPELAQSLQISSVHEGRELSEIVSDALTKYLSRSQASKRSDV